MSESTHSYEVAVVGGGPAGLTAALYTTRLGHDTVVINRGGGRAAMMTDTHNVIGVTEDVSGPEFLQTAQQQVRDYGAEYIQDYVSSAEQIETEGEDAPARFRLETTDETFTAEHVVLATGFSDERPDPPLPRTGRGLHWCLHCDAFMFVDEPVFVMGAGDSAAHVAMIMLNFTDDVDLLTRGDEPSWSEETDEMLQNHPVEIVETEIDGMNKDDDGWLRSFDFEDGTTREYRGGFPMYGSNYNAELADQLGVERTEGGEVEVDDHGRTNVDGVFAVGDLIPGHNQIPVAMGEGAKAGIAIHYDAREFPRSTDEIDEQGAVSEAEVPAVSADLMATAVAHEGHAGGPRVEVEDEGEEAPADD
jgi:thioredoxin reductase (NADPH)